MGISLLWFVKLITTMVANSTLIQTVTPEELSELLRPIIREELSLLQTQIPTNEYLSRQQAADRLHITLPTLHDYTRKGIIQGLRIGGRVLYSEEAIREAVKAIPTMKYRR